MDTIKIFCIYVPKNYIKKYVKEEIRRIPHEIFCNMEA